MKLQKILLALFATLLLFTPLASADSCTTVTVTTSSSSSTLTTGTSAVITATVTASSSSCTANIALVSTGQSSGASMTVSDPSTGSYSGVTVTTSGVSKTFTVSAGTVDTYDYYVTAGTSQSTSATITYIAPSTLTSDSASTPTSVTNLTATSQTFHINVILNNPQASSVSTAYNLSFDASKFSVSSGDASSGTVTIGASSSKTLSWLMNYGTAFTGSKTISLDLGDSTGAFTTTVTPSATPTPTPVPSSSSAGGGLSGGSTITNPATSDTAATAKPKATSLPSVETPAVVEEELPPGATPRASQAPTVQAATNRVVSVQSLVDRAQSSGIDTAEAESIIATAKQLIQQGKYADAQKLLTQAETLLNAKLSAKAPRPSFNLAGFDALPIVVLALVIIIAGIAVASMQKQE